MRNFEQDFNDTCKLMRKHMEQCRPQSFASIWSYFERQKATCDFYEIKTQDVSDILKYAKKENIQRFGFGQVIL